jgi:hypothetical protein
MLGLFIDMYFLKQLFLKAILLTLYSQGDDKFSGTF